MASHDNHSSLPGYDSRQLLHDGCWECEQRAKDVAEALVHMDAQTFAMAWRRAFSVMSGLGADSTGSISRAEAPVLHALWAVQCQFEVLGMPIDGELPRFLPKRSERLPEPLDGLLDDLSLRELSEMLASVEFLWRNAQNEEDALYLANERIKLQNAMNAKGGEES